MCVPPKLRRMLHGPSSPNSIYLCSDWASLFPVSQQCLGLQAGNDFLPSIPSLEIYGRPSGLDILLKTYKEQLPELGGPITNGVAIDPDRLKRMLTKLAEDEEDSFKRALVCGPAS